MNKEVFVLWVLVTGGFSFLLIFYMWFKNVTENYRQLKREKINKPFLVIIKQLSITKLLMLPLGLFPVNFPKDIKDLKGRKIWLEWDMRWSAHGRTMGEIEEVRTDPQKYTLLIRLNNPIELSGPKEVPNILIEKIFFKPRNSSTNLIQYYSESISGRLFPVEKTEKIEGLINHDHLATCEIVIY